MSNPGISSQSPISKPDNSQDIELEGYVHCLSPIKTGKKSRKPFFDCLVQTAQTEKIRAVCYDPQQRKHLVEPYQKKSPVKITATKRMASTTFSNSEEFKITKKAKIVQTSTDFMYNSQVASSVVTVDEAFSSPEYKVVDIVAKVITKTYENQLIIKQGKQLKKSDCTIGDQTGTIKLTVWEDLIEKVDSGKTYNFKNVKVRVFDDMKYLSTNPAKTIEPTDQEIQDINLTSDQIIDNILEGQFIGVHIKTAKSCVVCNATVTDNDADEDEMTTCPSSSCHITMLSSLCPTKLVCNLTIKLTNGQIQTYTCFNDGLQSFLVSVNKGDIKVDDISSKNCRSFS